MQKASDSAILYALMRQRTHSAGQVAHDLNQNLKRVARIQQAAGLDSPPTGERPKPASKLTAPKLKCPWPDPEAEQRDRRPLRSRRQTQMVPDDRADEGFGSLMEAMVEAVRRRGDTA